MLLLVPVTVVNDLLVLNNVILVSDMLVLNNVILVNDMRALNYVILVTVYAGVPPLEAEGEADTRCGTHSKDAWTVESE